MATKDELAQAVGCLGITFPNFVSREIALLTDQIVAGIQGVTDPLSDILNINVASIVEGVSDISEGDVWDNLVDGGIGYGVYLADRYAQEMSRPGAAEGENAVRSTDQLGAFREKALAAQTGVLMAITAYKDMPYVAVQQMCETLIGLIELKEANLGCLRRHITQLVNAVVVLAHNSETYQESILENLDEIITSLQNVEIHLSKTQRVTSDGLVFDATTFGRARAELELTSKLLAPTNDGVSILDIGYILAFDSVDEGQVNVENFAISNLVIPELRFMIEVEASAVTAQVDTINSLILKIGQVPANYRGAGNGSQVKSIRSRVISDIRIKVIELESAVAASRAQADIRDTSMNMLVWTARVKTLLSMMDQVNSLSLEIGSTQGPDRAAALNNAYIALVDQLTSLSNSVTSSGIESTSQLQADVTGLANGARRIKDKLAKGEETEQSLKDFHALSATLAKRNTNEIDESLSLASQQRAICQDFIDTVGTLDSRATYETLLDSMQQLGMDRFVDKLRVGDFLGVMDAGVEGASYLGLAIECLTNSIKAADDDQTKKQLETIRDDLLGEQVNLSFAATTSADTGIERVIGRLQAKIETIQRNGETIKTILADLEAIAERLDVDITAAKDAAKGFSNNIDKLAVGAGGRLADQVEQLGTWPRTGVPVCFPV